MKDKQYKIKGLVCSGGGCKGSFAAGILEVIDNDFDIYAGTSTGSLLVAMAAADKVKEAVELYTDKLNVDRIYKNNPYNKKNKIKILRVVRRFFFTDTNSLGSTRPLLDLIRESYTEKDHKKVLNRNKEIIITVTDMNTPQCIYISNKNYDWEQFTEWLWVSTLAYPITEYLIKDGITYADGGHTVPIALEKMAKRCDDLTAIFLNPENLYKKFKPKNFAIGCIDLIGMKMRYDTIQQIEAMDKVIVAKKKWKLPFKLSCYFPEKMLTENEMNFDKEQMIKFKELGNKAKPQ